MALKSLPITTYEGNTTEMEFVIRKVAGTQRTPLDMTGYQGVELVIKADQFTSRDDAMAVLTGNGPDLTPLGTDGRVVVTLTEAATGTPGRFVYHLDTLDSDGRRRTVRFGDWIVEDL